MLTLFFSISALFFGVTLLCAPKLLEKLHKARKDLEKQEKEAMITDAECDARLSGHKMPLTGYSQLSGTAKGVSFSKNNVTTRSTMPPDSQ